MTDTKDAINCPACDKVMTKIYIPEENINVDICLDGCGGIFLDNRELKKFDNPDSNIDKILEAVRDKEFEPVNEQEVRICPICKVPMVKQGSGKADIQIDVCNTCGARFLDNGELQAIKEATEERNERVEALAEDLYRANLKELLGKNAEKPIKSSPRRMFFENLVKNMMYR